MSNQIYPKPLRFAVNGSEGSYTVEQPVVGGWIISYNPDNDRFYVHKPTEDGKHGADMVATYQANKVGWSNLLQYCRTHKPPAPLDPPEPASLD